MQDFIETLAPYAMKHGAANDILPSLILAQGILETGGGTSELAREANNLFGIKKGTGWDGPVHAVVTSEYRKNEAGEDELYYITAEFRKYESYEGAVIDLCDKYVNGTSWEPHNRYAAVLGNHVFDDVAQAVKDAGYATDPNYPSLLQRIVRLYNLSNYDLEVFEDAVVTEEEEIKEEETEMSFRVAIDAGHGRYTAGKRTPAGEREWTFNNTVALAMIAELQRYAGVEILRVDDPTGNTDVGLTARTNKANAWGADVYVSIHHNANTGRWGTWTGTETFVMSGSSSNSGAMKLARAVHPRLVDAMGLKDRGIKSANFAVLRQTRMPAILTEGGYMDSSIDIIKMRNNTVLRQAGVNIAKGVVSYGGLKLKAGESKPSPVVKPTPVTNPNLFRVRKSWADDASQLGAFSTLEAAIDIAKKNSGYKVFDKAGTQEYPEVAPEPTPVVEDNLYRIRKLWSDATSQIGAFSTLDAAKDIADKNISYTVYDGKGNVAYDPRKARDEALAQAAAKEKEAAQMAKNDEVHVSMKEEFDEAKALGFTDGTDPNGTATRAQVAVMIVRAVKYVLSQVKK